MTSDPSQDDIAILTAQPPDAPDSKLADVYRPGSTSTPPPSGSPPSRTAHQSAPAPSPPTTSPAP